VNRLEGVVTRWLGLKGYGFIKCYDSNNDVFIHNSEIKNGNILREGERVRFDIEDTPRGPKAKNLEIL